MIKRYDWFTIVHVGLTFISAGMQIDPESIIEPVDSRYPPLFGRNETTAVDMFRVSSSNSFTKIHDEKRKPPRCKHCSMFGWDLKTTVDAGRDPT